MKYFNPSYWFKLWVLSAPLFNNETIGINAKSIDNKKIKDWANNNTSLDLINQEISFTNSTSNYQPYNLSPTNQNINSIYQTELETSTHKHRHKKSRNRDKRQPNPNRRAIFQLTEQLTIDSNNRQQYRNSFQSVLHSLVNNNILRVVFDNTENTNWGEINRIFTLNTQNYGYFRLPIVIRWQQNEQSLQRNFELVLRTDNLYIQGFIVTERGSHIGEISTYYHFDFREIYEGRNYINHQQNQLSENQRRLLQMWNRQPAAVRDDSVPLLTQIDGMQNRQLTGISPDYRDMIPTQNNNINWNSVVNSFIVLTNDINVSEEHSLGNLARSLGQVVFMTAEAIRFPDIYARIVTHLVNRDENLEFNRRSEIYRILVSWSQRSRNNLLQQRLIEAIDNINNPNWNGFTLFDLTRELNSPSVQVLLGYINFRLRNNGGDVNCRRGKREIKNTYWHEKFCDLKPKSDKIQGKITSIKILDEKTQGGNLKAGTIYVGTENGVYLTYPEGEVHKFNNLNFPIKDIILDGNGSAYVINEKCEIYHLNLIGWDSKKENMESCDLNKELKIYYNNDKAREQINFEPSNSEIRKKRIFTLNLGKINPVDNYKKIELLGDYYSDKWGTRVKWGSYIYDSNHITNKGKNSDIGTVMREGSNKLVDNIKNYKVNDDTTMWWIENHYAPLLIQSVSDTDFIAWVEGLQKFGFTFYWENENYYLQAITFQYLDWRASEASLECWMKIGNGIRLYNDDENIRTKREIFDKNNLEDKPNKRVISNELKNLTKWTDDFTKTINHEQHLSIDNKPNFSTNNITSL
ncbi:ribosome-inactivating family protein [Spiroplasma endosymbiont of Panzeria rudis]|uniref:ribosome-inactivating family protein n=1 Tax=Spiroplasma endosymbiont of Panzeria rudis TaxID=3066301 RepID=UPI0030D0467F